MTTPETPCLEPCPLERPWSRAQVHAPRGDETFVAAPALADAARLAEANRERLSSAGCDVQGRDLAAIRRWARIEVHRAAREYTRGLLAASGVPQPSFDADAADAEAAASLFFVGGHQPTLFHPGVWVKNFAVSKLAGMQGAVGLNLVVDTDNLSSVSIRVPTGPVESPRAASIAFDAPRPRQPWEEARIIDRSLFAGFPERVLAALCQRDGGGGERRFTPLLTDFWPAAVREAERSDSLVDCLTAARCHWERTWAAGNLELPVSRMCALEPFLWFASHLLAHLPRLHSIYNEALREYRAVNRVRSRTHPVPDLREQDGWLEAPFRVWRAGEHVRKRVFARQFPGELRLSDGNEVFASLPLDPGRDACCAVKELMKLSERGIRFRTRALTTTMFSRLCFADLFVHGIGGAKYDQMTDRIVARFFGLPAPEFLTISGTLRLPAPQISVDPQDERRLVRLLRELEFNSERHLPGEPSVQERELVEEKRRLISQQQSARARQGGSGLPGVVRGTGFGYDRFRRFQEINRKLAESTTSERRRIEEELTRTRQQLAASSVLSDREYAFCLYPADKLKRFMDHVCSSLEG